MMAARFPSHDTVRALTAATSQLLEVERRLDRSDESAAPAPALLDRWVKDHPEDKELKAALEAWNAQTTQGGGGR